MALHPGEAGYDDERFRREYLGSYDLTNRAVFTEEEVDLLIGHGAVLPHQKRAVLELCYSEPNVTTTFSGLEIRYLIDLVNRLKSARGGS